MTGNEMLALVKQRTKVADKTKRLLELRAAYRWTVRRVFNTSDGPDLLITVGAELAALAVVTTTYNLATATSTYGEFLGVKKLWVKLPADTNFVAMVPADTNEPEFIDADSQPAATAVAAQGHPVLYDVINFSQVRFAPPLPAGAIIRADFYRIGKTIGSPEASESDSEELEEDWTVGEDLPSIFHDAICNKAIAFLFNTLDDDREAMWHRQAEDAINDAIYNSKRVAGPTVTQPFRPRRRRYI